MLYSTSAEDLHDISKELSAMMQVMPFILRRTKDAVLKDLPPKILQVSICSYKPLCTSSFRHTTWS